VIASHLSPRDGDCRIRSNSAARATSRAALLFHSPLERRHPPLEGRRGGWRTGLLPAWRATPGCRRRSDDRFGRHFFRSPFSPSGEAVSTRRIRRRLPPQRRHSFVLGLMAAGSALCRLAGRSRYRCGERQPLHDVVSCPRAAVVCAPHIGGRRYGAASRPWCKAAMPTTKGGAPEEI
jgi:hypothetical protein